MLRRLECDLDKRAPLRTLWFANQSHVRFTRQAIALPCIAWNAGANDVFPRGRSAAIARNNMIEVEIVAIEDVAAVLAGILVALKDIMSRKLHFLFWQPIEEQQHDYARNADLERDCRDQFVVGRVRRKVAPTFEIVREKIIGIIGRNDVGVSGINQGERAADRADVHRLPETIEYENLTV